MRLIGNGPIGAGIDLVSWSRIARFLADHPHESLKRLLTPREQLAFQKTSEPVSFFARSFAAKEAFFKAQGGLGMEEASFRQIEVLFEEGESFRIRTYRHCEPRHRRGEAILSPEIASASLGSPPRNDGEANGQFFETPNGVGAKVLVHND